MGRGKRGRSLEYQTVFIYLFIYVLFFFFDVKSVTTRFADSDSELNSLLPQRIRFTQEKNKKFRLFA